MVKDGTKEADDAVDGKLAGKYDSPEELESGYKNLEASFGEQGTELGESRKTIALLTGQLEESNAANTATTEEKVDAVDYDKEINNIQTQIEAGEMTVVDGLAKTSRLTADMATKNSLDLFKQSQSQNALENSRNAFADKHPEFFEVRDKGLLDAIIKESPYPELMDDMSAFLLYDSSQKEAAAFEKGRAEIADIKKGADEAAAVLAGEASDEPGLDKLTANKQTNNDTDLKASMLAAGNKFRSG